MTTQLIRSDYASQRGFEKSSPEHNVLVTGTDGSSRLFSSAPPVTTFNAEPCNVYYVQAHTSDAERESFSAFDRLLEELDHDPASSAQLQDGRKWVASTFYHDHPTLASLRLAAGFSQRQLGEACGIEQPHVSRYESGKHEPSLSVAASMSRALSIGLDQFYEAWNNTRESLQTGESK